MLRFNNLKFAGFLVIFTSETFFQFVQVMRYTTLLKSYEKLWNAYSLDSHDTNDEEYAYYDAVIGYYRISVVFECIGFFRNLWVLYFLREFMLYQANSMDPVINEDLPTLVLLYGQANHRDRTINDHSRRQLAQHIQFQALTKIYDESAVFVAIFSSFILNDLGTYY